MRDHPLGRQHRFTAAIASLAAGLVLAAVAFAHGDSDMNKVVGTMDDDTLRGTMSADEIVAKKGNDTLSGLAEDDKLIGGRGGDSLSGGPDDDAVLGGRKPDDSDGDHMSYTGDDAHKDPDTPDGKDNLSGGTGDDLLAGGENRDRVRGGPGDDFVFASHDNAADTISCGAGTDKVKADRKDDVAKNCEIVERDGDGKH
jgi:Ca2+-binding RTX toxin-like protein